MKGRRSAELAAGAFTQLADKLGSDAQCLMVTLANGLTSSQEQQLFCDFETARAVMINGLALKLDFWGRLPPSLWHRALQYRCEQTSCVPSHEGL